MYNCRYFVKVMRALGLNPKQPNAKSSEDKGNEEDQNEDPDTNNGDSDDDDDDAPLSAVFKPPESSDAPDTEVDRDNTTYNVMAETKQEVKSAVNDSSSDSEDDAPLSAKFGTSVNNNTTIAPSPTKVVIT